MYHVSLLSMTGNLSVKWPDVAALHYLIFIFFWKNVASVLISK